MQYQLNQTSDGQLLDAYSQTIVSVAQKSSMAVGHVIVSTKNAPRDQSGQLTPQGTGSGFIIQSDGYMVTNSHVIANAANIKVALQDGRTFDAEMRGDDPAPIWHYLKYKVMR